MSSVTPFPVSEFRETGILHEINRLILHPLGLALEVKVNEDGTEELGNIWDCRDDPEGVIFGEDLLSAQQAENVANLLESRGRDRGVALGYVIQPLPPETKQLHLTVKEIVTSRVAGPGEIDQGEETRFAGLPSPEEQ